MKKRIISALLALVMGIGCFGLTACEADEGSSSMESSSVEENEEIATFYFVEKQIEFPVESAYETALVGLEAGETVTYSSNDETVATVDAEGIITGVKIGFAVIKATTNTGKSALTAVTVLDNTMIETPYIKLSKTSINLSVADEYYLSAELLYKGKTVDCALSWTSDNSAVAIVENGKITAVGTGEARLTVSAVYEGKTVNTIATVTVSDGELLICPDYAGKSVVQGKTIPLSVSAMKNGEVIPVNEVQYSVSDTKIALIQNGELLGRSGGDVTVTASFTHEGKSYVCSTPIHVYGEHTVTVYSFEGKDRTFRGLLYGETVTLSLLNPIDGRAVKCWYVNGEKIEGNTFSMLDENVVAVAKYVNETEEDFSARFSEGMLVNEVQARVTYKTDAMTDVNGNTANGGGYVYFDAPDWGSLQFNFDENVTVTATSKVKLRLYCPKETILLYFGIGENDTVVAGKNVLASQEAKHELGIEIETDVWTEIEIPLKYFAEIGTVISGFSISASSHSYCLLDDIIVLY
ncbi:MAG: Ig domain-containing protein [Clostridia bacterium]|nr:Ig domain-containing protein [Clostridia bacterium]